MNTPLHAVGSILLCMALALAGRAEESSVPSNVTVSYIYPAVMGTGTYSIDGRRISMLRVPFAFTQKEMTDREAGTKWHLPVVLGYDALRNDRWVERFLEDQMMTLTVLPGVEYQRPITEHLALKPFANLGSGYDFSRNETILMSVLGVKGLGTWKQRDGSEIRLGMSARMAYEYQVRADSDYNFALLEAGADYRRNIPLKVFGRYTNAGVFYRLQYFVPEWGAVRDSLFDDAKLVVVHEVGASIGFREPHTVLGMTVSRVRMGFKFGSDVRGVTIGTEFPF